MADYVTPEEVREALDLEPDDKAGLSDARAARLIRFAQALVENALGGASVDGTTGRKVAEADVLPWQWELLQAAVATLAARLERNPALIDEQAFESVSGPDFSRSKPTGSTYGGEVNALLRASGLQPTGARLRHPRRVRSGARL